MSHFKDVLNKLNESKDVRLDEKEDQSGMNGVKISDKTTLKFSNRDEADRARKVVSSYKKTNPSAGDKVVMRLCGLAKRMKGASVKEIIAAFEIATSDHIVKEIFT